MANLDEKLLDGPSVGYCSSSDEEDGPKSGGGFRPSGYDTSTSSNAQQNSTAPRTGPKGVLADYERHQQKQRTKREEENKEVYNQFHLVLSVFIVTVAEGRKSTYTGNIKTANRGGGGGG